MKNVCIERTLIPNRAPSLRLIHGASHGSPGITGTRFSSTASAINRAIDSPNAFTAASGLSSRDPGRSPVTASAPAPLSSNASRVAVVFQFLYTSEPYVHHPNAFMVVCFPSPPTKCAIAIFGFFAVHHPNAPSNASPSPAAPSHPANNHAGAAITFSSVVVVVVVVVALAFTPGK